MLTKEQKCLNIISYISTSSFKLYEQALKTAEVAAEHKPSKLKNELDRLNTIKVDTQTSCKDLIKVLFDK